MRVLILALALTACNVSSAQPEKSLVEDTTEVVATLEQRKADFDAIEDEKYTEMSKELSQHEKIEWSHIPAILETKYESGIEDCKTGDISGCIRANQSIDLFYSWLFNPPK